MKIRYLLFPLLAASAQPSLAAEQGPAAATPPLAPAVGSHPVRLQDLQRVADAMAAEAGRPVGANTREAIEEVKARNKAAKRPSRPADPADCNDCPEKDAARQTHSASQTRNRDCIHCIEEAILV